MGMTVSESSSDSDEIVDVNVVPLIDVMLVLLILFIITLPIQTHAVKLDLPSNQPTPPTNVDPVINRVSVDFLNAIYWNEQEVDLQTLRGYLDQAAEMNPQPEIHLKPDALSEYQVTNRIMSQAQAANIQKIGFVGNEAYAN
jgi:biopolymer transport protein ExbD